MLRSPIAVLALAFLVAAAPACLDNPMSSSFGEDAGDDSGGAEDDAGDDRDAEQRSCDDCTVGEARCHTLDDETLVHQVCEDDADNGSSCPTWSTSADCTDSQACSAAGGCECASSCTPGETRCTDDGLLKCLIVDECPVEVDVCRNSSCDAEPVGLDCDDDPDNAHCQSCSGSTDEQNSGRACVEACPGTNDCYTCGLP